MPMSSIREHGSVQLGLEFIKLSPVLKGPDSIPII